MDVVVEAELSLALVEEMVHLPEPEVGAVGAQVQADRPRPIPHFTMEAQEELDYQIALLVQQFIMLVVVEVAKIV